MLLLLSSFLRPTVPDLSPRVMFTLESQVRIKLQNFSFPPRKDMVKFERFWNWDSVNVLCKYRFLRTEISRTLAH